MRRLARIGAVALSAALLFSGCNANPELGSKGASQTPQSSQKGGTLNILTAQTEISFDPAKSQSLAITSLGLVNRRLTTWDISPDQPAKVVPDLATDIGKATDGGKTWTYTLKDGLKYDDGSPITSADIKYGLERSFAAELSGGLGYHKGLLVGGDKYKGPYSGGELSSIETPDDKTIVFKLNSPYGDWPWVASTPAFTPVPKAKDDPNTYGEKPAASGPYKVESYQQGVALNLTRNDSWDPKTDDVRTAGPDKIIFKLSQDPTVAAQALISDSGDAKNSFGAQFVPAAQLAQAQKDPNVKGRLVTSQPGALSYLAFNTTRGALKDVKVRQALQYAADRQAYKIAAGGSISGENATTLITPGIPGRQEYDLYPAPDSGDMAKAKKLLAATGHASDLKLTLVTSNDPIALAQSQALQQGFAKAGVKITLQPLDSNALSEKVTGNKGDYDLYLGSWQPDFPSPNGNIQPLFDSSQIGNGNYNTSRYSNPEVDKMIKQAIGEVDQDKAGQLWAEVDKKIMEDAPIIPLTYTKNSFLHGSNVQNFFIGAFPAYPNYLKVTLKQ
ncbi:ABC transporter substrate-binding protein [Microlunatus panaciterrae]|uniref:Peptide/nickel transport system substrate-binding protein n=1 Tax=Microlunatus panaciterrae TaxID=400768 RepID=A0ABS2RK12_9ACTN|nr:ABC transporter substrate-binding protein [Microlunatus panaciterrae]MBM7799349.1 peptide/nickel transport system substrate-binding protein [Microlunatus panaciterrae]